MSRPVSYTEQRLNHVILTIIIITISLDNCYNCYNYQHYSIVRQLFYCMAAMTSLLMTEKLILIF